MTTIDRKRLFVSEDQCARFHAVFKPVLERQENIVARLEADYEVQLAWMSVNSRLESERELSQARRMLSDHRRFWEWVCCKSCEQGDVVEAHLLDKAL